MKRKIIYFSIKAALKMAKDAIRGFTKKYKKESFGFLLGRLENRNFRILEVVPYKGGEKGRTTFEGNRERIVKRGRELAFKRKKGVLGYYHTHPEIAGEINFGISDADRESFLKEDVPLEFIVGIGHAEKKNYPFIKHNRDGSISLRFDGYFLKFSVYYKTRTRRVKRGRLILYI